MRDSSDIVQVADQGSEMVATRSYRFTLPREPAVFHHVQEGSTGGVRESIQA